MSDWQAKMRPLVDRLNEAASAYYQHDAPIMSDMQYDALYDELQRMERESGFFGLFSGLVTRVVLRSVSLRIGEYTC